MVDELIASLRDQYAGRWHITRLPSGALCAALEPGRGYHIVSDAPGHLARDITKYETDGYLVR